MIGESLHERYVRLRRLVYGSLGCPAVFADVYGKPIEQSLIVALTSHLGPGWVRQVSPSLALRLQSEWAMYARPSQIPPHDFRWYLAQGGRGSGKTRQAAEWLKHEAHRGLRHRLAILSPTHGDFQKTQFESIKEIFPFDAQPKYHRAEYFLSFPSAPRVKCFVFSAEEHDRLRGSNLEAGWIDELRSMKEDTLKIFKKMFRTPRDDVQFFVSTTPEDSSEVREVRSMSGVIIRQFSSRENVANLGETNVAEWEAQALGTTYGRRELMGEMVESVKGALWSDAGLDSIQTQRERVGESWRDLLPQMQRICISIDPAAGDNGRDECGLIVAGYGHDEKYYVMEDITCEKTDSHIPKIGDWCRAVSQYAAHAEDVYRCPVYVALENNRRREELLRMLQHRESTVRLPTTVRVIEYHAGAGILPGDKFRRASLVKELFYEADAVRHRTGGNFRKLHKQMATWEGFGDSPDRLDALVQALMSLKSQCRKTKTITAPAQTHKIIMRKF